MDKIQEALMGLLASAIYGHELAIPELTDTEWCSLCNEAKEQGIHLMIFYALLKQNVAFGNESLRRACKDLLYITALHHTSSISTVFELIDKMEQKNIQVMILKGLYFKTLYPKPELRVMGDVDFFIKQNDIELADKIMGDMNYIQYDQNHSNMHYVYTHHKYITIELHHSIVGDSFSESIKVFDRIVWDEHTVRSISGRQCIVPSEVNHAVYCCMHMMNHLRTSGFGLRHLCDLIFLINSDPAFAWDEFLEKARMLKIHNFVRAVLWICHTYLKFEIPEEYQAIVYSIETDKTKALMSHVLRSGEFGTKDKEYLLNKNLAEYQLSVKLTKHDNPLYYIFPSWEKLNRKYSHGEKRWYLMLIAWLQRLIFNITRTDLCLKEKIPNKLIIKHHKELVIWLNKE